MSTPGLLSCVSTDSALAITPRRANGNEGGNRPTKAMGITTNVISQATVRMIVTLTKAQVDGGIDIQPYIQQNSGSYSQAFGPIITDNLVTYEAAELADAMQLVGPITEGENDAVLIKQVEIDLADQVINAIHKKTGRGRFFYG